MVTIIGIVIYGLLRFYYSLFYGPLGVTPEEVGLGYVEVLQLSYAGLIVGGMVFLALAMILSVVTLAYLALVKRALPDYGRATRRLLRRLTGRDIDLFSPRTNALLSRSRSGRFLLRLEEFRLSWQLLGLLLVGSFTLPLLLGAVKLGILASSLSGDVKAGKEVSPPTLFGVRVLELRVERAQVWWTTTSAVPDSRLNLRGCLRYLGQANGISVFYDAQASQVLRVPAAAIVVAVPAAGGPDCKPAP